MLKISTSVSSFDVKSAMKYYYQIVFRREGIVESAYEPWRLWQRVPWHGGASVAPPGVSLMAATPSLGRSSAFVFKYSE